MSAFLVPSPNASVVSVDVSALSRIYREESICSSSIMGFIPTPGLDPIRDSSKVHLK